MTSNSCIHFEQTIKHLYGQEKQVSYVEMKYLLHHRHFIDNNDIVYLSGFGTPDGFWLTYDGKQRLNWCELINNLHTRILLIDSCYSGMVFNCKDFNKNIPIIITSTLDDAVSVNVPVETKYVSGYTSSFSLMLYLIISQDKNYITNADDLPGCFGDIIDPQGCQLSIICKLNNFTDHSFYRLIKYKDYHPNLSIGVTMINGKPWRH